MNEVRVGVVEVSLSVAGVVRVSKYLDIVKVDEDWCTEEANVFEEVNSTSTSI